MMGSPHRDLALFLSSALQGVGRLLTHDDLMTGAVQWEYDENGRQSTSPALSRSSGTSFQTDSFRSHATSQHTASLGNTAQRLYGLRASAVPEKLRAIQQEFDDNNLILRRMREDVSQLAGASSLARDTVQHGREEGAASSRNPEFGLAMEELDQHRRNVLLQIEALPKRANDSRTANRGARLSIAPHLERLRQYIKDQHA